MHTLLALEVIVNDGRKIIWLFVASSAARLSRKLILQYWDWARSTAGCGARVAISNTTSIRHPRALRRFGRLESHMPHRCRMERIVSIIVPQKPRSVARCVTTPRVTLQIVSFPGGRGQAVPYGLINRKRSRPERSGRKRRAIFISSLRDFRMASRIFDFK